MGEQSYAVFTKSFSGYAGPSIDEVEKYCFDARQRGASGKTNVKLSDYSGGSFTVNIPESDATTSYAAPAPRIKTKKSGIPTFVWLLVLVLALVLGFFV